MPDQSVNAADDFDEFARSLSRKQDAESVRSGFVSALSIQEPRLELLADASQANFERIQRGTHEAEVITKFEHGIGLNISGRDNCIACDSVFRF